jgi:two-component system chemotaxis response regulator CheY
MELEKYPIIVVDDSSFSRKQIVTTLQTHKFNVVAEFKHARDALAFIKENPIRIAIIDIVMPEITGIELAKSLTELTNNIAIIIISSLAQERIVIDAIDAGAIDFIQKPIGEQRLIDSILKAIEGMHTGGTGL